MAASVRAEERQHCHSCNTLKVASGRIYQRRQQASLAAYSSDSWHSRGDCRGTTNKAVVPRFPTFLLPFRRSICVRNSSLKKRAAIPLTRSCQPCLSLRVLSLLSNELKFLQKRKGALVWRSTSTSNTKETEANK